MPTIVFNAISAKKNAGGAYQVALNFIKATLNDNSINWIYIISEDLYEGLSDINLTNCYIFPTQPEFFKSYWSVRMQLREIEKKFNPDLIYTTCAPSYFKFKTTEVFRYTNPWITNPNKFSFSILSVKQKFRSILYSFNQKRLLRKRLYFITQTETAKKGILRVTKIPKINVKVVPNVLPAIYNNYELNKNEITNDVKKINILSVSAPHPAKNLDIIPEVCFILLHKYKIDNFTFHLTINNRSEVWKGINKKAQELDVINHIANHGYQTQEELIDLYRKSNLFFLPTLIEVFSASLLEAAYFGLPIVTTDFNFNKDVMKDAALYYTPMDAEDAANKLSQLILNKNLFVDITNKSDRVIKNHPSFSDSYNSITSFLRDIIYNNVSIQR